MRFFLNKLAYADPEYFLFVVVICSVAHLSGLVGGDLFVYLFRNGINILSEFPLVVFQGVNFIALGSRVQYPMAEPCGRVAYGFLWRQFGSLLSMHISSVFSHSTAAESRCLLFV